MQIPFNPISRDVVIADLVESGVPFDAAAACADAAGGDLGRARLLAGDPVLVERLDSWIEVARTLDGSGHKVAVGVDELLGRVDDAAAPLKERHEAELAELTARVEAIGERGSGRKDLEARHKRELRRHRTDEFRAGLAVVGRFYRDEFAGGRIGLEEMTAAGSRIVDAARALSRNPNEKLLLQDLFCHLPQRS
ncbi:MAG: hypothetical protein GY708_25520 [Actinomycetia bacterium]|nr:hypothetical protein [Actinomycetes bacterium]